MGYLEANRSNTRSEYDHIPNLVPVVQTTYSGFPSKLCENVSVLGKQRFYSSFATHKRVRKMSVDNRSHLTAIFREKEQRESIQTS